MKNVLWTGGWDSTFRILELTILKKETVQPYYVLDRGRSSVPFELKAMEQIKEQMVRKFPFTKDSIKPPVMIDKNEIPLNEAITKDFHTLLSRSDLGSQYEWLARYAEANGLSDWELCIHVDDKATNFISSSVKKVEEGNDSYFVLSLEDMPYPELTIFKYFHFPILRMSKLEMGEAAKQHGFDDIMERTWFCHNPRKDGTPCGMCNPCVFTRNEGLGRRVPNPTLLQRAGYQLERVFRKLKTLWRRVLRLH